MILKRPIQISAMALGLILEWLPGPSYAVDCDTRLTPSKESSPYTSRANRCEGIYAVRKVTDATLDIVGFVQGRFAYRMDHQEQIQLAAPNDLPVEFTPVLVRAQPFQLSTYYRMDSVLENGASLQWPVGDVLLPEKIRPKHISVYGYHTVNAGTNQEFTVHIALQVKSQLIDFDNDNALRLYLRASQDIEYLSSTWSCSNQKVQFSSSRRVHRSGRPIIVFPPAGLHGLCLVNFQAFIKKIDSVGRGNEVKQNLVVYLNE